MKYAPHHSRRRATGASYFCENDRTRGQDAQHLLWRIDPREPAEGAVGPSRAEKVLVMFHYLLLYCMLLRGSFLQQ